LSGERHHREGRCQNLEKIRIILGFEVTKRTREVIEENKNRFLKGLEQKVESGERRGWCLTFFSRIKSFFFQIENFLFRDRKHSL
jgi:hypothetical protein